MHQIFNVPAELRALKQWCVWRYEDVGAKKPTKVPYSINGKHVNVNDSNTWCSFDDAFNLFNMGGYDGLGFVFTDNDPFTFVDLDDAEGDETIYTRQLKIFHEFDSYSEISPSGKGLHIIVKGHVTRGRKRSKIEIYSSQRFATMTGNSYGQAKTINERQELLQQLWEQMGSGTVAKNIYNGDEREQFPDNEIIAKALSAVNGDKFKKLIDGTWNDLYQSQSEADLSFINVIAFYTQNKNQIARIFRSSPLGQRAKANRQDYVNYMINKSFDRMLPPIDIDGFKIEIENKITEAKPITTKQKQNKTVSIPPGLLGDIARFIYEAAPRPVPEIALAAAIGLMAGIAGRAYNISGTGLNQYIMIIANTGAGKEAAASGIDKLMNAIKMQVPTAKEFIGPSEIASGQALIKHLGKRATPCFVSVLGEFGLRLQSMTNQHANSAETSLKRVLLDLYNKSGYGKYLQGSIYADNDKNTNAVESPTFTLLGESTPERFYGTLNEDMIAEGLLPRFILIEYTGLRPPLSGQHLTAYPSISLIDNFAGLAAVCSQIMHAKKVINVQTTNEAAKIFEDFDKFCDDQINGSIGLNKEVLLQLWNRAHIKAMKLAALVAVGVNMTDPCITIDHALWAIDMVNNDIRTLSGRFDDGDIGQSSSESKQQQDIIKMMIEYVRSPFDTIAKYSNSQILHRDKIIPYSYINRRLVGASSFRNDKMGATNSIKRVIQTLIDSGKIREIGRNDMTTKYGSTQRAFMISDIGLLD